MTKFNLAKILFLLFSVILMNGCINLIQKTKINEDLTGTINMHYWVNSMYVDLGDVEMGDDIGGLSFKASEIKKKYSSPFSEVSEPRRYNMEKDSTTHIEVDITFKDFNKLTETSGFSNIDLGYEKGDDVSTFHYKIPKDTAISLTYTKDWNTLTYTFEFPGEIIETNGKLDPNAKDKNIVTWEYKTSDHAKNDLEFTAKIKNKSGICGLFGIELPVVLLFGLVLFMSNSRKKNKAKYEN